MTTEVYEALTKPFPREALSIDNSRGFNLTSIKAQYIKERLNEVFGVFGWHTTGQETVGKEGVLYKGTLHVTRSVALPEEMTVLGNHEVNTFGYSVIRNGNIGDALKGAQTDFISKAASFMGVGNEVFKGNVQVDAVVKTGYATTGIDFAKRTTPDTRRIDTTNIPHVAPNVTTPDPSKTPSTEYIFPKGKYETKTVLGAIEEFGVDDLVSYMVTIAGYLKAKPYPTSWMHEAIKQIKIATTTPIDSSLEEEVGILDQKVTIAAEAEYTTSEIPF